MSRINDFVCWAGGADLDILAQCPEERNKFQALGLGVLVTCIMAFISMGFALFSLYTEPFNGRKLILPAFMVFWSVVIFSIDWGLIKTMHKKAEMTRNEWAKYILGVAFRFLVATVISFTISKPLEVKIFESELKHEVKSNSENLFPEEEKKINEVLNRDSSALASARQEVTEALRQNAAAPADPKYESLGAEITSLQARIITITTQRNNIQSQINEISRDPKNVEIVDGRPLLTNSASANKKELQDRIRSLRVELAPLISERNAKQRERSKIETRHREQTIITLTEARRRQRAADTASINNTLIINQKRKEFNKIASEYNPNLITYIKAMSTLEKKSDGVFLFYVRWLIFFLILMVDTAPIVIKLLFKRGTYEEIVERIEYERIAQQSVLRFTAMKEREVNKILINDVSISQNEIIKSALASFQQDETQNMQQNFRSYFRTGRTQQNQSNPEESGNTELSSNMASSQVSENDCANGSNNVANNESAARTENRENDRFVVPPRPTNNDDLNPNNK